MKLVRNMRAKPIPVHVYRNNIWHRIMSSGVLPGDIISLARGQVIKDEDMYNPHANKDKKRVTLLETIVPCDVMLLTGSCVLDEALLTGESVPQIKEPINISAPDGMFICLYLYYFDLLAEHSVISLHQTNTHLVQTQNNRGIGSKSTSQAVISIWWYKNSSSKL